MATKRKFIDLKEPNSHAVLIKETSKEGVNFRLEVFENQLMTGTTGVTVYDGKKIIKFAEWILENVDETIPTH